MAELVNTIQLVEDGIMPDETQDSAPLRAETDWESAVEGIDVVEGIDEEGEESRKLELQSFGAYLWMILNDSAQLDPVLATEEIREKLLGYSDGVHTLKWQEVVQVVDAYGGSRALFERLRQVLPPTEQLVIIEALQRRLNGDRPTASDIKRLQEAKQTIEAQREIGRTLVLLAEGIPKRILEQVDEWLGTAKAYYDSVADELAMEGYPISATVLQTANDLLLPGSSLDLALETLPISRIPGLLMVIFKRIKLARPAVAELCEKIISILHKKTSPDLHDLANQAAKGDGQALATLIEVEERMNNMLPARVRNEILPPPTRQDYLLQLEEGFRDVIRRNPAKFQPPPGSQAKVRYFTEIADNAPSGSSFVEEIEVPFKLRDSGRVSRAYRTAKKAGLQGLPGQHWGHIWPEIIGGDDAVYNLIRMDARINLSYMKWIDNLKNKANELSGKKFRIRCFYESVEDGLNRHAVRIEYDLLEGEEAGRWFEAWDLEVHPEMTRGQLTKSAIKGIEQAKRAGGGDLANNDPELQRRMLAALSIAS